MSILSIPQLPPANRRCKVAIEKGLNLISVGYAAKLIITAAAKGHNNVFPGRVE